MIETTTLLPTQDLASAFAGRHVPDPGYALFECVTFQQQGETRHSPFDHQPDFWRDDRQAAIDWSRTSLVGPPPSGPGSGSGLSLGVALGPEFQAMPANLARNIRERF